MKKLSILLIVFMVLDFINFQTLKSQSSGITTPEFISFEPVDVTDMVNILTGDFNYTIPLINIPSPEGGYPLALSYHAGITLEEESSWVGLGWNINAGAINRFVNGIPDDSYKSDFFIHDTWSGGSTYQYGLLIPLPNGVGVNVGFSNDTYTGFSMNYVGMQIQGIRMGVGQNGMDLGYSLRFGGGRYGAKTSIGISLNGIGGDFSAELHGNTGLNSTSVSYDPKTGVGYSMSMGTTLGTGGFKGVQYSTNANGFVSDPKISTETSKELDLLFYSQKCTRYWIDSEVAIEQTGIVNSGAISYPPVRTFDRVILWDELSYNMYSDKSESLNPETTFGASFPAYDIYNVSGQGIGGNIQPLVLENGSLSSHPKTNIKHFLDPFGGLYVNIDYVYNKPYNILSNKKSFRFLNDFSNSHIVTNETNLFQFDNTNPSDPHIDYIGSGLGYTQTILDPTAYDIFTHRLTGSYHIDYFSNEEINNETAKSQGFSDYSGVSNRLSFSTYDISKQIGGFSITKPDGITYHYALPAYSYGFLQYHINTKKGTATKKITSNNPYAYLWLLTTITGPDYFDKNNNGYADEGDYGQWINFRYGKWTDSEIYRSPGKGGISDLDGSKMVTGGYKQRYYLDAVYTRTHTAIFAKSTKEDGRMPLNILSGDNINTSGGFSSISGRSLKLNEIVLLKNESIKQLLSNSNTILNNVIALGNLSTNNIQNLIDHGDLAVLKNMSQFNEKVIKLISFIYDYSLVPETPNNLESGGKLTLKGITSNGRSNCSVLPPYIFNYELKSPKSGTMTINYINGDLSGFNLVNKKIRITCSNNSLEKGDIICFSGANCGTKYATILDNVNGNIYDAKIIGFAYPTSTDKNVTLSYKTTKNPPYEQEHRDMWGAFKSDYVKYIDNNNDDITRLTTEVSQKATDVWSLRNVITPTGTELSIDYESDSYTNVGVQNPPVLNIKHELQVKLTGSSTYSALGQWFNCANIDLIKLFVYEQNVYDLIKENIQIGDIINITSSIEHLDKVKSASSWGVLNSDQNCLEIGQLLVNSFDFENNAIIVSDPYHFLVSHVTNKGTALSFIHFGSYITLPRNELYGGGIRVKSVSTNDNNGNVLSTKYSYENGTTSFEPLGYDGVYFNRDAVSMTYPFSIEHIEAYKRSYWDLFKQQMLLSPILPSPSVLYNKVSKETYSMGVKGDLTEVYEFQTFNHNMIQPIVTKYITSDAITSGSITFYNRIVCRNIKDYTSSIGDLISYKVFSQSNQLVSSLTNEYTSNIPTNQGIIQEVHNEHRTIQFIGEGSKKEHLATTSVYTRYPSILISMKQSYLNQITEIKYNKFDAITGQPTEIETILPSGKDIKTEIIPAFRLSDYQAMGLKITNSTNKNMLTQEAATFSSINIGTASSKNWKIIGVGVQTWNSNWNIIAGTGVENQTGVWRKHKTFAWK
ncbi:MAG: hypothetical protein JXB49_16260, partial [Bacteroidales bacterium]|nr:hypothetical protein [Bacteroidales bacterium]